MSADNQTYSGVLSKQQFKDFKLASIETVNHNTNLFTFELESQNDTIDLPTASCVVVKAPIDGEDVIRAYTPVSTADTKGKFELMVKDYPTGKMSRHIHQLKVGDSLAVKGPFDKIKIARNTRKHIGMIAGGTGITPMLQVLHKLLNDEGDNTKVSLVFANQTPDDILCKEQLDKWAEEHERFSVFYLVDRAPEGWTGGVGYVTPSLLKDHLPASADENVVLVCGPPGMMKAVCGNKNPDKSQGELSGLLLSMGYTSDTVFKF